MATIGKHTGTGRLLFHDEGGGDLLYDPGSDALLYDGDVWFNQDAPEDIPVDPEDFEDDWTYSADSADRWSYRRYYSFDRRVGNVHLTDDEVADLLAMHAYPNELEEQGADSALLSVPGTGSNPDRMTFQGRISCVAFRTPYMWPGRDTYPARIRIRGATVTMSVSSQAEGAIIWCGFQVFRSKPDRDLYPGRKFYQFSRTTPTSCTRVARFPLSIVYSPLVDPENGDYSNIPNDDRPHIYVAAFPENTFLNTGTTLRRVELSFSSMRLHTTTEWKVRP